MAFAKAGRLDPNAVINQLGKVQAGATLRVNNTGTGTAATAYTNNTKSSTAGNPTTTTAQGNYPVLFFVPGDYDVIQTVDGVAQPAITVTVRPDPSDIVLQPVVYFMAQAGAVGDGSADDSAAFQAAVDAVPSTGGVIDFAGATGCKWTTQINLPKGLTGPLVIRPRSCVMKPSGAMTVAIGTVALSAGDTVKNITVKDMIVDASAFTGSYFFRISGTQINVDQVRVRRVTGSGLPVDASGVVVRWWFLIESDHASNGLAQNTITHIYFEDSQLSGGNAGFEVGSFGAATTPNVVLDEIHAHGCTHDMTVNSPVTLAHNGFHFGGKGKGYKACLRDCRTYNGMDAAFEVNAFNDVTHDNCEVHYCAGNGFYHTNYQAPPNPDGQRVLYLNCRDIEDSSGPTERYAFVTAENNGVADGEIIYRSCKFARYTADPMHDSKPEAFYITSRFRRLVIDDATIDVEGFVNNANGAQNLIFVSNATPARPCSVTLRDIRYFIRGSVSANSMAITGAVVRLAQGELNVDRMRFDVDITGQPTGTLTGLLVGDQQLGGVNCLMGGEVRRVSAEQLGDSANAACLATLVQFGASTRLTPDKDFQVVACDGHRLMTGSSVIFVGDATNKASIFFDRDRFVAVPVPIQSISVGASPFTYQNLDGYRETVTVQGGTVSKIEKLRPGQGPFDVGTTAGEFFLENGDSIKVTYTVAPTMLRYPFL